MSKKLFIAGLIVVGFVFQSRTSAPLETVRSQIKTESSPTPKSSEIPPEKEKAIKLPSGGKVEFKGVSFRYNPEIFGEVKVEEVDEYALQEETDKPDFVEPRHLSFRFGLAADSSAARIEIFPIEDFPRMYAVNKDSVKAMEKDINDFKRVLKDKNYRVKGQIPYLRFVDAAQAFQARVEHFKFQSGSGIFFLTHWDTEAALISNDHLEYIFEGLTSDGKYYVLAEMPASAAFLPESSPDEFEGYKRSYLIEDYPHPDKIKKRYRDYISSITRRLENLSPDKYEPNLKHFEELISSLKIEK